MDKTIKQEILDELLIAKKYIQLTLETLARFEEGLQREGCNCETEDMATLFNALSGLMTSSEDVSNYACTSCSFAGFED